ncbi:hypothetical protein ACFV9C_44490 [Kribbella sp. NPDC059898]|uniref:hypothetical protein n=1 Tax=Kribbella sp. NPDC059898 TaxID=3346995 RepID=UPI003651D975
MTQRQTTPTASDLEPGTVIETVDGWSRIMAGPDRTGLFRIRYDDGTETTFNPDVEPFIIVDWPGQTVTTVRHGPYHRDRRFTLNFNGNGSADLTYVLFEHLPGRPTIRVTNHPQFTVAELNRDDLNRLVGQLTELRDQLPESEA